MNTIDRKNNAKQYINENIINIEKQIKLLNNQKKYYQDKLNNLEDFDTFTKEEIKEILEYFVSNYEKEKYSVEELNINTRSSSYHIKNMVSEYTFLYLVKDENKENAINELKEKYDISVVNGENYIKSCNIMEGEDISDNYIKLSFYNRYIHNKMKFNSNSNESTISIDINDEKYNYINEFINSLLNRRLDSRQFKLSISEIKLFIDRYTEEKEDIKKNIYTN